MQQIKWFTVLLTLLFCLPLALQYLPQRTPQQPVEQLVYASQNIQADKDVLVVFTHSHEAYGPIVKTKAGKTLYYDEQYNIAALATPITAAFKKHQMTVHTLETDVMKTMKLNNAKFAEAYKVARPYIEGDIKKNTYDLILDIHRDSAKKQTTTLKTKQGNFAKIALVVGLEHPSYNWNLAYAEQLNKILNELLPGISRGIVKKEGKGVNGVYNQDLSPQMLLIEIGGVDNNEEELNNTIEVLSEAIYQLLDTAIEQTTTAKQSI